MSNLGPYQDMTIDAYNHGGPKKYIHKKIGFGATIGGSIVTAVGVIITIVNECISRRKERTVYTIEKKTTCNNGQELVVGDEFRVKNVIGDNVIIELLDDNNTLNIISYNSLQDVSNFRIGGKKK